LISSYFEPAVIPQRKNGVTFGRGQIEGEDGLQFGSTIRDPAIQRFVRGLKRGFHFLAIGHIDPLHENVDHLALVIQSLLID
jgi:hypothetical protein